MSERVVVTGLGCVSPLGLTMDQSWTSLIKRQCGIDQLSADFSDELGVHVAAQVKDFDPSFRLDGKTAKRMERFSQFAYVAACEAMEDSGISISLVEEKRERIGVSVGVGMGGVEHLYRSSIRLQEGGPRRVSPMVIPQIIPNMASGMISHLLSLKGPNICTTSACASGTHGIGEGYLLVKHGYADAMIAGGAESAICDLALASFANMRALSREKEPSLASLPFDEKRGGFVMGEGAGVMMLESLKSAQARGADIYAEILGYGMSGDAYHMTHPAPQGEGAARCIRQALDFSRISEQAVDHVNAHGTATPLGDLYEAEALKQIFSDHKKHLWVSATKGATGHLLGGAGGLEACFTALALKHQLIPPTIPLSTQDPLIDLNLSDQPQSHKVTVALSLSLGFGGTNAAVVFKKFSR